MVPPRLERGTYCLEGSCSIQLSYGTGNFRVHDNQEKRQSENGYDLNVEEQIFVGVAGFEPTTSTSQMWRDTGLRYTPKDIYIK